MKNSEKYLKANDKIQASEKLKRITKNKILENKNKKSRRVFIKLANVTIIFLLVFSILWIANENKDNVNEIDKLINPGSSANTKVIGNLPTVGSKEDLVEMIKKSNQTSGIYSSNARESTDLMDAGATQSQSNEMEKSASDYSETNAQVEGVKEADIVKTDGEYIYYLTTNKVVIVDARNTSRLKIVKEMSYKDTKFNATELFLNENKLIVIGTKYEYPENKVEGNISEDTASDSMIAEDYAYVDRMYPYNTKTYTVALIYDITSRENAVVVREIEIEGSYLSARMIDDNIYLVSNKYIYSIYRTEDIKDEDIQPAYKDTIISTDKCYIPYTDICYFPDDNLSNNYMIVAGFNINSQEPANIGTYLGAGNIIYSSLDNLYVTKTKYTYNLMDQAKAAMGMSNYEVTTDVYKFKLNGSKIEYKVNGSVPGYILNQFSMDEYKNNFRLATTVSSNWNSNNQTNNLYILDENLKQIGKVENLAKGERIYSVRFMGEKGYIVTFKEVDPLFVMDLSNPTLPKVLGELKIPGYSNYLHPYDENHIIGFGEEVKNTNSRNSFKMALFDVTDHNKPKELYSEKFGDDIVTSEIVYNHKTLLFSKEKNIIAFPAKVWDDVSNRPKFQGAFIYELDLEKGFTLKGEISHQKLTNIYKDYDYNKEVERIIYIGDTIFTFSKGLIKATDINTMKELGKVEITIEQNDGRGQIVY